MKKTRKNMLRSSAAMLLVSALALTTATYAWFTTGNGGKVSQISLTAQNDSGIQLSADAENWKGTITLDDLTAQTATTIYSDKLSPRSSDGTADSSGKLTLYGISRNEGTGVVSTTDGNGSGIVKFDLYARNTATESKTFYLDLANGAAVTGTDKVTGIENAIRVAFVNEGSQKIEGTSYVSDVKAKAQAGTVANGKVWLWEPNSSKHRTGSLYSGPEATSAIIKNIPETDGVTLTDKGIIAESGYLTKVTATLDDTTTTISKIAEIPANTIVKFTVYIWLEGQDVDCTDQEANGSFTVDLVFTDKGASTGSN
jgi:hypothetical protein